MAKQLVYEGQKLAGKTWIVVIGKRKDRKEVKHLLLNIRTEDSTLGGLIAATPNKNAKLRIVTWERISEEYI